MVSTTVTTLTCACSDTNLVLSGHIKRGKAPFPVDVHRSNISFA